MPCAAVPRPVVFGYHEVFHLLVIALVPHFLAISLLALLTG